MKLFLKYSYMAVIVISLASLTGCIPLLVGAAAGVGGVTYVKGAVVKNLDEDVETLNKAANEALKKLGLYITSDEVNQHSSYVRAEDSSGKAIQINIEALTEYVSKITIRVGVFGDEDYSYMILDEIEAKLK